MPISAMQAAKAACQASNWTLSNLQLHKILYIAHMIYAGRNNGRRLIGGEDFEAWDYGPVLSSVYHHASGFGSGNILNIFNHVPDGDPNAPEYQAIREAVNNLSELPPFQLVDITHAKNSAWDRLYVPGQNVPLDQDSIISEYNARYGNK